jgi:tetratricopeptide (TPR) repeat protein
MPQRTYMGVDPRRDHSFRIPRPDRSLSLGVPNACDSCHQNKGAAWSAAAIRRWYPTPKAGAQDFAETFRLAEREEPDAVPKLSNIVADGGRSGWVRASALRHLGLLQQGQAVSDPAALRSVVTGQLEAKDDTLRWAAVNAMAAFPAQERAYYLAPRLSDARRLVRIDAARHLAGEAESLLPVTARPAFVAALKELIAAEQFNADRPEAMSRLGDLYAARGQGVEAEKSYQGAIKIDPGFAPAWVNFALLLEQQGRPLEATALLRQAAASNGRSAEIEHALGLALIRQGAKGEALAHLGKAASLNPASVRMAYVHIVAEHDIAGVKAALKPLRAAIARHPHNLLLKELGARYFAEAGS